ncbi:MAG TPA: hypothetical protein VJZ03_01540 [Candidatus Bathyarchaeia archaeon]|nr:hypothetical protein [Candidatus Bathyarchaeia archaeon]
MKKRSAITSGQVNKLIDVFCHRRAREDKWFWVVDGILHAAVEQNPEESVSKFVRFNLPKIVEQTMKESNPNRGRRKRSR